MNISQIIKETKQFYLIDNFEEQIYNWIGTNNNNTTIIIGQPNKCHRGNSLGDKLIYTAVPRLIKINNQNIKILIHNTKDNKILFKKNIYIDGYTDNYNIYGSLGPFGNTIQRCCNVYSNYKPILVKPELYLNELYKNNKKILICTKSNSGGNLKNISLLNNITSYLKTNKYNISQLALNDDQLLENVDQYYFNITNLEYLIDIVNDHNIYLGIQNSIYHLSKSLGLKVIGILPNNINPNHVILPLLKCINYQETNMLNDNYQNEIIKFKNSFNKINLDNIGWLYPDIIHLTENIVSNNYRCPILSIENIKLSLQDKIYPFNKNELWDYYKYIDMWK